MELDYYSTALPSQRKNHAAYENLYPTRAVCGIPAAPLNTNLTITMSSK